MSLPMVLLHGWGMNSACWNKLLATETERDLVSLDLPGHGKYLSDRFPQTLDELAKQMLERAPTEAIWCGWSLGSLVAMRAAILAPDRVKGLVLVAPTPRFVNSSDWNCGMDPTFFDSFTASVQTDSKTSLRRFVLLMFDGCNEARQKSRDYFQRLQEGGLAHVDTLLAGLNLLEQTDLRSELHLIAQPTYLLTGSRDQICPSSASQWLSENFDWPLTEIESGHAAMLSHAELLLNMATDIEQELCLV